MAKLTLERLSKTYANGAAALVDVNLSIAEGELLVLVGPSGCGKTTLLRVVAGLENATSGQVFLDERDVTALPARERDLCLVSQRPALFPGKTVRQNLAFAERVRHPGRALVRMLPAGEVRRRQIEYEEMREDEQLQSIARTLGLVPLLDRPTTELSGGEQQRVALGRAWLRRPKAFLLDEPLSHVDTPLRWDLRRELHLLQRRLKGTMIYVTHDPAEALGLADRIAVMGQGVLHQVGSPSEISDRPVSKFVAQFGGKHPLNCLDGRIDVGPSILVFEGTGLGLCIPPEQESRFAPLTGKEVTLGIRPEDVAVSDRPYDNSPVEMMLEHIESTGVPPLATCVKGAAKLLGMAGTRLTQGQQVIVSIRWNRVFVFDRQTGRTLSAPEG